jgi:glycerophosphoryl diester phosphodiesterase
VLSNTLRRVGMICMAAGIVTALGATEAAGKKDRSAGADAPIVIAHRGASGYVPEHTLAAYSMAILQGADFIEPDLVMTKDGHLVARHDLTTDVAQRPEFADRRATKTVDGASVTGWFSEDFTLDEIKQLRAIERIPDIRPANSRLDGQFKVPTLQEIIDLVKAMERSQGRRIGIYPETKHPTHFAALGLSMEEPLVKILHGNGYAGPNSPVFIQSFEVDNLKKLNRMTRLPLIQLLWSSGQPYDQQAAGSHLTYDQMATPQGLAEIASYADGVGPEKNHFIIPLDASGRLDPANATTFVRDAHAVGLKVHPYTFRAENAFLPANLRDGSGDAQARGDAEGEIRIFLSTGIDGFFTDHTDAGVRARDAFLGR